MLLGPGDVVKLADFGLAAIMSKSASNTPTEIYMSPEQTNGVYSFPADIWYI